MSWSTRQVRTATTALPWTKDFRHLQSFPRHWLKRFSFADQNIKAARVKDRIKYWNIVPGDQVRVRGDESERILEVSRINKLTNRVYLKGMGETVRASVSRPSDSSGQVLVLSRLPLASHRAGLVSRTCTTQGASCSSGITNSRPRGMRRSRVLSRAFS